MENIVKELGLNYKNVYPSASPNLCTVVVHNSWLKKWLKNKKIDNSDNHVPFVLQPEENIPYPYRKIFIRVLNKKVAKVLPLPRYKLCEGSAQLPLTFSQILQYVSQHNQRNLWKESHKKYCQNIDGNKDNAIVNVVEHNQLLAEVLTRLYGCNIIKVNSDDTGEMVEYKATVLKKDVSKSYEAHTNFLAALFILETENNFYVVYRNHYGNNLLDCLNFSPNLIDMNYTRGMFLVYQLLNALKAVSDRGLSIGMLSLKDIYLSENLWLQLLPSITNNVHSLDASLVHEQSKSKSSSAVSFGTQGKRAEEWFGRNVAVQLEKLCILWVKGRISNLDYLLHLNLLAGRQSNDPQAHFMVPWVTDFASRCGKNWRDLSRSKYRLNKGDRQLDMTYELPVVADQVPHHVTDALSDITCYVYLARRTPKEILCKHVRNKWVPAEYPASIQRMQEWSPDECIPEFYTDPTVFKSIHEDLPDLGIPSWATCVEDFISKHREALESAHVSENLHHWIDITFGYKLSGGAAVKAKNVCLSLVDGHTALRRGGAVQLLAAPHPPRRRAALAPPHPPRVHWTAPRDTRKTLRSNESSEDISDDEDESSGLPRHVSRLHVPAERVRSRRRSGSRARSLSKGQQQGQTQGQMPAQGQTQGQSHADCRASSHTRHYRVQRSEYGKGVIYLPKEFNPVASIQALEALDNFRSKCFFSKAEDIERHKDNVNALNLYPMQQETTTESVHSGSDDTAFTNHMFLASYDQSYLKKFTQDNNLESVLKERKNRSFNTRYTTDGAVYKQFVTESRRQDMLVIGCLIVEIFLHNFMRPLRTNTDDFAYRYNSCRTVLKYNFNSLPKCVSYIASLLLNVQPVSLSYRNEMVPKQDEGLKRTAITDKGLPPPSPSQLLQPLLMQHLIPFPQSFKILYSLLNALHEYELTSNELSILYTYECDGVQCEAYQNVDKTKLEFTQRIAEGKIQACITHLDVLLDQATTNQFDVLDIFLTYYIELLRNKDTSVLAAWYLFDTVSKALGPEQTRQKILKHILNLYEDDDFVMHKRGQHKPTDLDPSVTSGTNKHKFLKLYHNIFLLQLMVRLGLQCFLDNFTQHLVEAVGGYKDSGADASTPGHVCHSIAVVNKKPRYSDDNVKIALSTANDGNIFSPDTSYGSEQVLSPGAEKKVDNETETAEVPKEKDLDNKSENEMFIFESDKEGVNPSRSARSKSPADSIESYTMGNIQEAIAHTPSPLADAPSPKDFSPILVGPSSAKELNLNINKDENPLANDAPKRGPMSPSIDIPSRADMFTSYSHFADKNAIHAEARTESHSRQIKSLELNRNVSLSMPPTSQSYTDDPNQSMKELNPCKISEMSCESLIWLAHKLGPVLTCRYITRNLLKMLTLCYIGRENLSPRVGGERDDFDEISVADSRVVGDGNSANVIKCLTSIVAMYGEQLIIFQYLPHMSELLASCRRRLSGALEGGAVACLHLLKYLVPLITDAKLMEQLQDTFLKCILLPALRLCATSRSACPSGAVARRALARKLLDALHVLALRCGPEITRRHLAHTALQRFFLAFDKATGKVENWPKPEDNVAEQLSESSELKAACDFVEICRDGTTAEWTVRDGQVVRADLPDPACSPPPPRDQPPDAATLTAQQELLAVFDAELAHRAYDAFSRHVGADALDLCLKNADTVHALRRAHADARSPSSPLIVHHQRPDKRVQASFSDEPISPNAGDATLAPTPAPPMPAPTTAPTPAPTIAPAPTPTPTPTHPEPDRVSCSNSFGSHVTLVGNRIDVAADARPRSGPGAGFEVVSYKMDNGFNSERHLRGDWLIYWEHEIGRPDKEARFNLKQIKLQTFAGHTHSVKSIHCLDNETSFMSGSKDKTVRLWSLRNQGDGSTTTQCNWTYTGHKKGVLSLAFLESQRLAVSTDSVVHIWDPFMESVVSQLDSIKSPVSIVRTLPGPSPVVVAATTDGTLKVIDARACQYTHDLKVPMSAASFVRCMCACASGAWLACGLASGHVAVVHVRTGRALAAWRAHDGEVLRLAAVDEHRLLTSGLDQTTALWNVDDGELIAHLKGTTEPVHCLAVYYDELITGTTNNRIGVHTSLGAAAAYCSTKLRSDTFRGVLTCMSVLPLNRLLLLGSDNGTISLLC